VSIPRDLVAASATPLILSILAARDSYGYEIIREVRDLSGHALEWTDGMLYPVLHRLEEHGYVASYWTKAETGRQRKYYRVLDPGMRELERLKQQWRAVDATLRRAWAEERVG
jgi:DNA-binding PadR family transcriptional regulator